MYVRNKPYSPVKFSYFSFVTWVASYIAVIFLSYKYTNIKFSEVMNDCIFCASKTDLDNDMYFPLWVL